MSDTDTKPRWGRTPEAEKYSGLKKGKLYELARKNQGLLKKADTASIWNLDVLDRVLTDLPDADLG